MKKVKVVDVTEKAPKEELFETIRTLKIVNLQIKELEKKEKELKKIMEGYFEDVPKDTLGNRYITTPDNIMIKREIRRKNTINPDRATMFFSSINRYDEVVKEEVVTTFNEDAIEQLLADGDMTLEDLENITDTKETYATVFVKEVKVEEEENENV